MKHKTWLLALAVALTALLAALFLFDGATSRASNRSEAEFRDDAARGTGGDDAPQDAGAADAARLKELIAEHGGFRGKGRVILTRPEGPGADLDVAMRGLVAGVVVAVSGRTRPDGTFDLPALPCSGDFAVTVTGGRVQDVSRRGFAAPDGDVLDLGDLAVDRLYFVVGRVLGNGRTGVADAEVRLTAATGDGFSFLKSSQRSGQEDPVVAETRTGATGDFALRLKDPGTFTLGVRAEGWASTYRTDLIVGGAADTVVKLALTRGYEVAGWVFDAAGRPVSGAAVTYYAANFRSWSWPKEIFRTDGDGRFGFRVEPRTNEYVLSATSGAGLDLTQRFTVPLAEDLVLRAPGAGVLKGRVVDAATSQPVAAADVLLTLSLQPGMGRGMPDFSKAIRTDPYGAFRVEGVGDSHLQSISVRADGYADLRLSGMFGTAPQLWDRVRRLKPSGASEVELPDLPLDKGRTLAGTVTDVRSGNAVAGATVELWDFVMGNRATVTDPDGTYRFDHVGDRVAMIVVKDGYAPFRESPWPGFDLSKEAQQATRDLAIEPGGVVQGVVKTRDGEPVARALVRLEAVETGWRNWTARASLNGLWTYTGADGAFVLEAVPPMKVRATARAPGFDEARSKDVTVETGGTSKKAEIVLLPAASIEGLVVARDGTPVRAARITATRDPGSDASDTDRWRALGRGVYGFSDEQGRFRVEGVPVGDVQLRVEAEGFATTPVRRPGVEPAAAIDDVRIELAPSYTIEGRVVNARGEPVTNCWVRVRHTASPDGEPAPQLLGTRVERDGAFAVRNLAAGTYTVEVRVSNWGATAGARYANLTRENVAAGLKDLALELKPAPPPTEPG